MASLATPVDFDSLVLRMKEAGAFDNFKTPLKAEPFSYRNSKFDVPNYPGQDSFGNGPAVVEYSDVELPQELVRAQAQSMRAGMAHYFPRDEIAAHIKHFISGNFLRSPAYKRLVSTLDISPYISPSTSLDNELTMQLDHPNRARTDRRMFTEEEFNITRDVCRKTPVIVASVLAYQAAFIDYLGNLDRAIDRSGALSDEQRERAHKVVARLTEVFVGENMAHNFIPAIALHYRKNNEKSGEPPTLDDFSEGVQFLLKNGAFGRKAKHYNGQEYIFTCPARQLLTDMTKIDLGLMPPADNQNHSGELGNTLLQISELAVLQMRSGCLGMFTGQKNGAEGDIQKLIDRNTEIER